MNIADATDRTPPYEPPLPAGVGPQILSLDRLAELIRDDKPWYAHRLGGIIGNGYYHAIGGLMTAIEHGMLYECDGMLTVEAQFNITTPRDAGSDLAGYRVVEFNTDFNKQGI